MKAKSKQALKFLSLVIALFIASVMIINTAPFDEELNPEIIKIMQAQSLPLPAVSGNAYFALLGITSETNEKITKVGFNIIQQHIAEQNEPKESGKPIETSASKYKTDADSDWQELYESCNSITSYTCLSDLGKQISHTPISDKRLILMLNRYEEVVSMPKYQNYQEENGFLFMPLPQYSILVKLSQLQLARHYQTDSNEDFLKKLNSDFKFWKMMLDDGMYLIDKMVALSAIRNDIYHLSEFLRNTTHITPQEINLVTTLLKPLTKEELDLSNSFIAEARMEFMMYKSLESNNSFFDNLFYQPNATQNESFENNIKPRLQLGQLNFAQLLKVRESEKATIANNTRALKSLKLTHLYNFIGKTLASASACACSNYVVRGLDVNNIIKMVSIQLKVKMEPSKNIPDILNQQENLNPYNHKAFDYNAQSNSIKFECLDTHYKCQVDI
jgi:hypothetical protein